MTKQAIFQPGSSCLTVTAPPEEKLVLNHFQCCVLLSVSKMTAAVTTFPKYLES